MLNRLPIKISAPLLVGIPVLVVGVWLSVMWNRQSRAAVDELADRNIAQIHDMAADKVAEVLALPMRVCQVNGHLVESGALDPADLAAWRPTLVREARAFDMLSSIVWGDADGRAAWVSRYADGSNYWALKDDPASPTMQEWRLDDKGDIAGDEPNTFDFDLYARPWYRAPLETGQPAWCEPYVWVGGEGSAAPTLGISFAIPLYRDTAAGATAESAQGELLGVIDADFSLNDLSSYLQSMQIGNTGVAALMTPDGRLLAISNETPIVTSENERAAAADSADAMIAAAGRYVAAEGAKSTSVETSLRLDVAHQPHYLRVSPVGGEAGLAWLLVTVVPESDFTAEIDAEFRRSWLASLLAVALAVAVGFAAARWLVSPLVKLATAVRRIGQGDLETRVNLTHAPEYANLAQEINQMTAGLQDRHRMRQSLSLAMEVQKNLLPDDAPTISGLDIAGHSTYCDETGGDYYDFLDVHGIDQDTAVIAIGDVMGHGVAAAMLMATARGILRSRCSVPGSLADFLEHLNSMLTPDTGGNRFMTMLLLTLSPERDEMRWASAGHGPPFILNTHTGEFLTLDGGGLPLGLVDVETYEEYVQPGIGPGHIIVAATDGLWETMSPTAEAYGMERLETLLRQNAARPAREISELIRNALAQFRGPAGQDDDLTFVIAKVV